MMNKYEFITFLFEINKYKNSKKIDLLIPY
jgi:hypothetical protein